MKTITEFSGFVLADALKKVSELTPKQAHPRKKATEATPQADVALAEAAPVEAAATEAAPEVATTEVTTSEVTTSEVAADVTPAEAPTAEKPEEKFDLSAALAEAFKLEGDKLTMFMNALEVARRRPKHIKRVVVMSLNEGEKAPSNAFEKDGKYYLLEQFFVPEERKHSKGGRFGKDKGGRGDRRGDKKGGGKKGSGRSDGRGDKKFGGRPRGEERNASQPLGDERSKPAGFRPRNDADRKPRVPREPRGPREERSYTPAPGGTGQTIIKLLDKPVAQEN